MRQTLKLSVTDLGRHERSMHCAKTICLAPRECAHGDQFASQPFLILKLENEYLNTDDPTNG